MLVSKIVLTGGPCGGKTTALSVIEQELTDMGYKVYIIDEVATKFINAGVRPFGQDKISNNEFEDLIMKHQILEEESFERVCKMVNKRCVLICDRGIFDIKSFLGEQEFNDLLRRNNLSKLSVMDSYNLVIDMVTAAKGAARFYTTENNKARKEDVSEAIIKENNIQMAWSFHSNLKIIDNTTDFSEKVSRCIDEIKNHLGIERRFQRKFIVSVDKLTTKFIEEQLVSKINIKQTYLDNGNYDNCEFRIRKRTLDNESTYFVTIKRNKGELSEIITEEKISENAYERLLTQAKIIGVVEKERMGFIYENSFYKLDNYDDEVYVLETTNNSLIPPFFKVIREVTFDENYKNINLAKKKVRDLKGLQKLKKF